MSSNSYTTHKLYVGMGCWLALVSGGCTTTIPEDQTAARALASSSMESPPPAAASSLTALDLTDKRTKRSPIIYRGSGRFIQQTLPAGAFEESQPGDITLNFDATPINEVVRIIVADYLGKSYTIDPSIQGVVTLNTIQPLRKQDLLATLETLLQANGAVLVQDGESFRVMPAETARKSILPSVIGRDSATRVSGYRSVIIPLKHIAAAEMEKVIKPYGVSIVSDERRNMVTIAGSDRQITQLLQLIDMFDVDWMKGMSFGLFPLEDADAATVTKELKMMFADEDSDKLLGLVRIVAIDRLNSILVISPQHTYVKEVGAWIQRLDSISDQDGRGLLVYRVQHGKASDLAAVLGQIFDADIVTDRHDATPESTQTTGESTSSETGPMEFDALTLLRTPAAPLSKIRIIADEVNNALVIVGGKEERSRIQSALRQLDTPPLQVLIEASIIEVRLTDDLRYGLEWLLRGRHDDYVGEGLLDLGTEGIGAVTPGFSYVVRKAGEVRLAINALAEDSRINVLSSPSLMVLNNQTAIIRVGDEVPIPTRQSVSNIDPDAPTVNEIEYRNTGVLLTVTPRVNASGVITMDVEQEVSDVTVTTTSDIDAPTFLQRQIRSTVSISSGETVVLGGLIRDQRANVESGVPVLYKIPILGKLFGQTTTRSTRTELLVIITPRALYDTSDLRAITSEYRLKMQGVAPIANEPALTDPNSP